MNSNVQTSQNVKRCQVDVARPFYDTSNNSLSLLLRKISHARQKIFVVNFQFWWYITITMSMMRLSYKHTEAKYELNMNFDIWILGAKIQIFSEKIELFSWKWLFWNIWIFAPKIHILVKKVQKFDFNNCCSILGAKIQIFSAKSRVLF